MQMNMRPVNDICHIDWYETWNLYITLHFTKIYPILEDLMNMRHSNELEHANEYDACKWILNMKMTYDTLIHIKHETCILLHPQFYIEISNSRRTYKYETLKWIWACKWIWHM